MASPIQSEYSPSPHLTLALEIATECLQQGNYRSVYRKIVTERVSLCSFCPEEFPKLFQELKKKHDPEFIEFLLVSQAPLFFNLLYETLITTQFLKQHPLSEFLPQENDRQIFFAACHIENPLSIRLLDFFELNDIPEPSFLMKVNQLYRTAFPKN